MASTERAPRAETRDLVEELERLEFRSRMLLAEHRHVVAAMRQLQEKLDATKALKS